MNGDEERVTLSTEQSAAVQQLLPHPHELDTEIALPDSVSIAMLAHNGGMLAGRRKRSTLLQMLSGFTTADDVTKNASNVFRIDRR